MIDSSCENCLLVESRLESGDGKYGRGQVSRQRLVGAQVRVSGFEIRVCGGLDALI